MRRTSRRCHVRLLCLLGTSCEVPPSAATGGTSECAGAFWGRKNLDLPGRMKSYTTEKYRLCCNDEGSRHYGPAITRNWRPGMHPAHPHTCHCHSWHPLDCGSLKLCAVRPPMRCRSQAAHLHVKHLRGKTNTVSTYCTLLVELTGYCESLSSTHFHMLSNTCTSLQVKM